MATTWRNLRQTGIVNTILYHFLIYVTVNIWQVNCDSVSYQTGAFP